jgi:hypothetical protein
LLDRHDAGNSRNTKDVTFMQGAAYDSLIALSGHLNPAGSYCASFGFFFMANIHHNDVTL